MADRVLALSMRPRALDELVGQDEVVASLTAQFASGRIPHFFIIAGPVGAGKTTLARILAPMLVAHGKPHVEEINAANKTGVDDVRQLIETLRFKPLPPARAKVVIMDEAHQLSPAAQNALLTETEDVSPHVFYVFCTSALHKLLPALQRRAFVVTPRPLAAPERVRELLERARQRAGGRPDADLAPLLDALRDHEVSSPGLILQAAERFFSGVPASASVTATAEVNAKIDTLALCRAVARGDWAACAEQLQHATKADVVGVRASVLGYLRTVLLRSAGGARAAGVARAMHTIATGSALPKLLAAACLACSALKPPPHA